MDNIKVISSSLISNGENVKIRCTMSDFSCWTCDLDGTNWEQNKLSDKELTELFNKRNG
jgi:hypothetical protein